MIRPFRPDDASACCGIIHACLHEDTLYSPALRSRIRDGETPHKMLERAACFYVAVYEETRRVLGFVGLDLNEVRLLYVDPGSQRRGIGHSLLEHVESMVPGTLFRDIFVYSTPGAVGFYQSGGFINKGQYVYDPGGLEMKTIFMSLAIPALR